MEQPRAKTRRRRWLSFSLRAFFILLTAICVWLGYQVNAARRQREAVAALEKLGAYVAYDVADPYMVYEGGAAFRPPDLNSVERWIANRLGKDYVTTAIRVQLASATVRDEDLLILADLPGLEAIQLQNCPKLTDATLAQLPASRTLTGVVMNGTPISDRGVRELAKFPRLQALWLGDTRITDAAMEPIGQLTSLTTLDLQNTAITDAGFQQLHGLTKLYDLTLSNTKIGDESLRTIGQFPQVSRLFIDGTQITDAGLKHLAKLENLGGVWLKRTEVRGPGLKHFAATKGQFIIRLNDCPLDDEAVPALAGLPTLMYVDLGGSSLSPEAVAELQTLRPTLKITPP